MLSSQGNDLQVVSGRKTSVQDIELYLKALDSYLETAAHNPKLTFEEHYWTIAGRCELRVEPLRSRHATAR